MARGFLVGSAALLMVVVMLSPAMAYTVCSYATSSYSIGTGTPHQYSIGSSGLQGYSIGSGTPREYSVGSSGLQGYSIGSGTPYQYTIGSSALQPYSIGMGIPGARTGTCEVTAPVTPVVEEPSVKGGIIPSPIPHTSTGTTCGRLKKASNLQGQAILTPDKGEPIFVNLSEVRKFDDNVCVCKKGSEYWPDESECKK